MACLDTTMLIDLSRRGGRRRPRAFEKLQELVRQGESLATTRFNVAELLVGVERSSNRRREEQAVQAVLEGLAVLDFDGTAAKLFAQITAYLYTLGKPAGDMDVLIAATALSAGHRLITRDVSHFCDVPQLVVETY